MRLLATAACALGRFFRRIPQRDGVICVRRLAATQNTKAVSISGVVGSRGSLFWRSNTPNRVGFPLGPRYLSTAPNVESAAKPMVDVSYEVTFRCPKEERDKFSVSRSLLPISVGQLIHEGQKFRDAICAVNKAFASCVLLVDDSIQAATHMLSGDMRAFNNEEEQWQNIIGRVIHAIIEGDKWLARNQKIIKEALTIPTKILRWYEWRNDPDFSDAIKTTHKYYRENEKFRAAVDKNVAEFLARYEKNHPGQQGYIRDKALWLCRQYLLEECAVMIHLWPKLECQFEVYPSGRNVAMQAAYELFIQPHYPHLLKPVALRFHKRGLAERLDEPIIRLTR